MPNRGGGLGLQEGGLPGLSINVLSRPHCTKLLKMGKMGRLNLDQDDTQEFFRERQLLQEKARRVRAQSPTTKRERVRESVTAVKNKLQTIKTLAPDPKNNDNVPPDSSPEPPGHKASSSEAQAVGLPPLPDIVLSPPPPSLLGCRAGVRLRHSEQSLHRYCQSLPSHIYLGRGSQNKLDGVGPVDNRHSTD